MVKEFVLKYGSTALTALAIGGLCGTLYLGFHEFPKAKTLLENAEKVKGEPLEAKEKVVVAWKPVLKTAVAATATAACIIGAQTLNTKQIVALTGTLAAGYKTFDAYKDEVIKRFGLKESNDILNKAMHEVQVIKDNPPAVTKGFIKGAQMGFPDKDETRHLFYFMDDDKGVYFESTFANVLQAEVAFVHDFALGENHSTGDFMEHLGLQATDEDFNRDFSYMYEDGLVPEFDHMECALDDGQQCWVISYVFCPEAPSYRSRFQFSCHSRDE